VFEFEVKLLIPPNLSMTVVESVTTGRVTTPVTVVFAGITVPVIPTPTGIDEAVNPYDRGNELTPGTIELYPPYAPRFNGLPMGVGENEDTVVAMIDVEVIYVLLENVIALPVEDVDTNNPGMTEGSGARYTNDVPEALNIVLDIDTNEDTAIVDPVNIAEADEMSTTV